jgi:cytochrome P450
MGWILTHYNDVLAVLRDRRVSSQRPPASEPVRRSLADVASATVKALLAGVRKRVCSVRVTLRAAIA